MLRALKNCHIAPRLLGIKGTSAAGAATLGIGGMDFTAASAATGRFTATLVDKFARKGIIVGSPSSADVGGSGSLLIHSDPTVETLAFRTHNGTADDDGTFYGMAVGWDAPDTDTLRYGQTFAPFSVKGSWFAPRLLAFRITGHASSPAINDGSYQAASLTRNGAGDYTVTFKRPFANADVVAFGIPIHASRRQFHVVSTSRTTARVLTASGGTGADMPFYLFVLGSDALEVGGRQRRVVHTPNRLARLLALHVSYSAGAPSYTTGAAGEAALTDTGTGQLTLTFGDTFGRIPIIMANQSATGNVTVEPTPTTSVMRLNLWDTSGNAADPDDVHILVYGSQDAGEYAQT